MRGCLDQAWASWEEESGRKRGLTSGAGVLKLQQGWEACSSLTLEGDLASSYFPGHFLYSRSGDCVGEKWGRQQCCGETLGWKVRNLFIYFFLLCALILSLSLSKAQRSVEHHCPVEWNQIFRDFLGGTLVKNLPVNAKDAHLIPRQTAKIPHASWPPKKQNIKQKQYCNAFNVVAQSCPTLCDPMDCSTPGFPVLHYLPELAQTHVHWVNGAIKKDGKNGPHQKKIYLPGKKQSLLT